MVAAMEVELMEVATAIHPALVASPRGGRFSTPCEVLQPEPSRHLFRRTGPRISLAPSTILVPDFIIISICLAASPLAFIHGLSMFHSWAPPGFGREGSSGTLHTVGLHYIESVGLPC